jgi:hypothetical protein
MCSSKNVSGVYLIKYFSAKDGVFWQFLSQKMQEKPFSASFLCISAGKGASLPPSTLSTTTPWLGTPPANSQRTKQFLSRTRGL